MHITDARYHILLGKFVVSSGATMYFTWRHFSHLFYQNCHYNSH